MNERIKELRKFLNLTMEKFGERLGVRKTAISLLESGRNNLTEQMLLAICREFGVSEEWLRTGAGDMFVENSDSIIDKILSEMPLDELSQTILRAYIEMDVKKREAFNSSIKEIVNLFFPESKEKIEASELTELTESVPEDISEDMRAKIEEEIEAYRKELEAEVKGVEKSSATDEQNGNGARKTRKTI